jgi:sarcosine oxidase subunit alpha
VTTADDTAYAVAAELKRAGVAIAAIADLRPGSAIPAGLTRAALEAGMTVMPQTVVVATSGRKRIQSARLGSVGSTTPNDLTIACDALLMSGGWTPAVHLFSQSRGKLVFDDSRQAFVPGVAAQKQHSVGGANGTFSLADCFAEGFAAGASTAGLTAGEAPPHRVTVDGAVDPGRGYLGEAPASPEGRRGRAFVDFQNDVTTKDLRLATREGFRSIEHVKRYTTTGMATDQGKTSNLNALAVVSETIGKSIPDVGLTTFRMPYTPVTFGAFAGLNRGALFDPVRHTPMHQAAVTAGAVFEDVGTWKRARYFPRSGENMDRAVARECRAVRERAGIFDASTLGKIEIVGPDAAEFLNRVTPSNWTKLEPGRARYSVLLSEAGFIIDDGIIARIAPDRFHMTTTTGGAPRVLHHLEDYIQTEFPELKCWLTSTTEQWAVIAVQGPRARDVIAPLVEGIDLTTLAMPHMSVREGRIAGVPTRLMRVSFTGEMGYEINVPADHGAAVWDAIVASGAAHGTVLYGTEAMHVLRAEKGYIIVGQETDGTVIPQDVGLGWTIAKSKPDFVGKRSLARPDMLRDDRRQLVGLLSQDGTTLLEEGAQIVADPSQPVPMTMLGHVTSAYASGTIDQPFALALVSGGRKRIGSTLHIPMPERTIAVEVVEPVFVDKEGVRLHG